jgi:2-amino-4-hydroxy-6-hydroxymethyldihydropteridine diphosphokinase
MSKSGNTVYLLLGGNLLDVELTFKIAREKIDLGIGEITVSSKLYQSEPWGFDSTDLFLNQVLKVNTRHQPLKLLETIQNLELELGRIRSTDIVGFESRVIDIDILYYNSEQIQSPNLEIPHYALQDRRFTLLPLVELSPGFVHPVLKKTNMELLQNCSDNSVVTAL